MIRLVNIPPSVLEPQPRVERSAPAAKEASQGQASTTDQVEFSQEGIALSRAVSDSTRRIMRIAAIRDEIRAGTYETTQRIDGTVDRILRFLSL